MWQPGEIGVRRGVYRNQVWDAQAVFVVRDAPGDLALALLPGAECRMPAGYTDGKPNSKRRWHFKDRQWKLQKFYWHTNRILALLQPQQYYSTILFWDNQSNNFLCYYINFQLPYRRSHQAIDTLDLDLDLIINPDYSYEWKDIDDYEKGIETEVILPEWIHGIEAAKQEIFDRLEKRKYPFDGSWLNWKPSPTWSPPGLPEGWDRV